MAAPTDIADLALSILGKPSIASFTDNSNTARIINIEYDLLRRGMLEGPGTWRFSIKRTSLPSLTTQPASGPYQTLYQLPSDCIRILQVGDMYPGLDLSDYRQGPTDADYTQEGRMLLCDYGSPLSLQYVADVSDTTQWNPNFVIALAAQIAWYACERLTGSDAKQAAAEKRRDDAYSRASMSNALVNPPQNTADSEWMVVRNGNA